MIGRTDDRGLKDLLVLTGEGRRRARDGRSARDLWPSGIPSRDELVAQESGSFEIAFRAKGER